MKEKHVWFVDYGFRVDQQPTGEKRRKWVLDPVVNEVLLLEGVQKVDADNELLCKHSNVAS